MWVKQTFAKQLVGVVRGLRTQHCQHTRVGYRVVFRGFLFHQTYPKSLGEDCLFPFP